MSFIPLPNYTQVPNYIIDEWMSKLTHAEFKFIMLIVRYTCGYHRREAKISYTHFEKQCGIDKRTAIRISKKFEKMEWIKVSRENEYTANTFEILLAPNEDSKKDKGVTSDHGGGDMRPPGGVTSCHYNKEKEEKKKTNNNGLPAAAVVFPELKDLLIPDYEKQWLLGKYTEEEIKHGIAFATHPLTKIKESLIQTLKWACENQPEIPRGTSEEQNRDYLNSLLLDAVKLDAGDYRINRAILTPLSKYVEIFGCTDWKTHKNGKEYGHHTGNVTIINFEDKNFIFQIDSVLKKYT